jgi:predicted nucleic acid-binding protein
VIILDTNVVSELMKAAPRASVLRWIDSKPPVSFYVTTITQAEVLYGIRLLPKGGRRAVIEQAALEMFERDFETRILTFDSAAAAAYAEIAAARRVAGRPISALDAQIAAIARIHGAAIATRNLADFKGCGVETIDPWQ